MQVTYDWHITDENKDITEVQTGEKMINRQLVVMCITN